MPTQGVFAEVKKEGVIRPGDVMEAVLPDGDRPFTAAVITLSDKGAKGERKDESGPAAKAMLEEAGYEVVESMKITNRAMLSRGVSVIRKKTLIVNLPGSPKAVRESLGFVLDSLEHGLKILRGSASECARQ